MTPPTSCRKAQSGDRGDFLVLGREFILEMNSDIVLGPATERHLERVFRFCVEGHGACILAPGMRGFTAAIEMIFPYDHKMGRAAMVFGTWVASSHRRRGIARLMEWELRRELQSAEFDTLLFNVYGGLGSSSGSLDQPILSWRAESLSARPGVVPVAVMFRDNLRVGE